MIRTTVLLLAVLGAFLADLGAQQPRPELKGFLDIPWGAAQAAVKEQVKARTGARLKSRDSTEEKLWYEGGKFAGLRAKSIELRFTSGKFYFAEVVFDTASKSSMKEFAALQQSLIEKYGPPSKNNAAGANPSCVWYFTASGGTGASDELSLFTKATEPGLWLLYRAESLKNQPAKVLPAAPSATQPSKASKPIPVAKDDL